MYLKSNCAENRPNIEIARWNIKQKFNWKEDVKRRDEDCKVQMTGKYETPVEPWNFQYHSETGWQALNVRGCCPRTVTLELHGNNIIY